MKVKDESLNKLREWGAEEDRHRKMNENEIK